MTSMKVSWRLFEDFVSLVLLGVAYADGPYPRVHQEIGPFNERDYDGARERGIATVRYTRRVDPVKWARQPYSCYGVFVDPLKVVTPCSCVAYPTKGDNLASNPWFHQTDDELEMTKIPHYFLIVGLMRDEHIKPYRNVVAVLKVEISPTCKADFRNNLAMLTLSASPLGYKLIWLYSADWLVQKFATEKAVLGASAGAGRCEVLRWADHGKKFRESSRLELADVNNRRSLHRKRFREEKKRARYNEGEVRFDRRLHQRVLQHQALQFLPWLDCLEQICPQYSIPPYNQQKPQWDLNECQNNYTVTRYCVDWYQMDSLCMLLEGTPVFCDVGDLHGVFGLLSNHTLWCGDSFNFRNVMIGIDGITNALYHIARIRNAPGYDNFGWPDYLDEQKTPNDYHLV